LYTSLSFVLSTQCRVHTEHCVVVTVHHQVCVCVAVDSSDLSGLVWARMLLPQPPAVHTPIVHGSRPPSDWRRRRHTRSGIIPYQWRSRW